MNSSRPQSADNSPPLAGQKRLSPPMTSRGHVIASYYPLPVSSAKYNKIVKPYSRLNTVRGSRTQKRTKIYVILTFVYNLKIQLGSRGCRGYCVICMQNFIKLSATVYELSW